jgi:hypothetical protein
MTLRTWLNGDVVDGPEMTNIANQVNANTSQIATNTSDIATKQPLDADLTALAALTAPATKLNGIEALADVTDAANVDAAGAVMNSDTSTASMSFVIDEDSFATDSATKVPTQQSVKAYVLANGGGGGSVTAAGITDSSAVGRAVLTAPTAADARNAIGAGTGGATTGITSTTLPFYPNDAGPALRTAVNTGSPVFIAPGTFRIATNGAITTNTPHITGTGNNMTAILLDPNVILIDASAIFISLMLERIRFTGGYGYVRNTYTGSNVNNCKVIQDCVFLSYTGCAISNNASDSPDWKVLRNIFLAGNYTTSMGVALRGLTDSCVIADNEFEGNRVHIKLDRGNNVHVENNAFLRFGPPESGLPRVDIHICNAITADNNRGAGGTSPASSVHWWVRPSTRRRQVPWSSRNREHCPGSHAACNANTYDILTW